MTDTQPRGQKISPDDPHLVTAKENLQKFRSLQTKYYLKIAEEIASVKGYAIGKTGAGFDVDAWLETESGLTALQVKSFCDFDYSVPEEQLLTRKGVSPDVIAALAEADDKTRSECLTYIERGELVDVDRVRYRETKNFIASMSARDLAELRRTQLFQDAATKFGAAKLASIKAAATKLLDLIDSEFETDPKLDRVYSYSQSGEADQTRSINSEAAKILAGLNELFEDRAKATRHMGGLHHLTSSKHIALASVRFSRDAMRNLTAGRIAPEALAVAGDGESEPRWCIEFLAGRKPSAVADRIAMGHPWRSPSTLRFVDIDAGVGGAALGLKAAGMHPALLLARSANEAAAIEANGYLNANVLSGVLKEQLVTEGTNEIDLLTCGMPWHHYEVPEAKKAYENALEAVEVLKPKAFLFETRARADDGYKGEGFEALGYDIRWYTLDGSQFGLVRSREREILVGGRDGLLDAMFMPILQSQPQSLAATIGDLVGSYGWDGSELEGERACHKIQVDEWLKRAADKPAPHFPNDFQKRAAPLWRNLGIDIGRFVQLPPSLVDLDHEKGFKLSSDMVKRIQGYPDVWNVNAGSSLAKQAAGSFPPVIVKMVGLAIHSALTGVEFDFERALRVPLLEERKKQLHPGQRSFYTPGVEGSYADPNRAFRIGAMRRRGQILRSQRPGIAIPSDAQKIE